MSSVNKRITFFYVHSHFSTICWGDRALGKHIGHAGPQAHSADPGGIWMKVSTSKCLVSAMMMFLMVSSGLSSSLGEGGTRGPMDGPAMPDFTTWTDEFDDSTKVNTTIDTQVTGGSVQLAAGKASGLVASVAISPPEGYRYDMVDLTVLTPGNSTVQLSILNATKESTLVGYVNDPIPGFLDLNETQVSINTIGIIRYPSIRLQADLVADGTNRPVLLSWTVYFVGLDVWRDDFLGTAKMSRTIGLNVTSGNVEINLTRKGGTTSGGDHLSYPAVFAPGLGGSDSSDAYYANPTRTGYNDKTTFDYKGIIDLAFGDLNADGRLDMVLGQESYGGSTMDSHVFWGTDTDDEWTDTDSTALDMGRNREVDVGDFNGDGLLDIVMAVQSNEEAGSAVFLNQGGDFTYQPSVVFTGEYYHWLSTGDVNGDGFDDICFGQRDQGRYDLYYGGVSGLIDDFNGDGYMDVALGILSGGKIPLHYGGPTGPSTTADLELAFPNTVGGMDAGDINGDGYLDLVAGGVSSADLRVWTGDADGWSDTRTHDITISSSGQNIVVTDVDLDGYDDILFPDGQNLKVFFGGDTLPTTPGVQKSGWGGNDWYLGVAVPNVGTGSSRYRGSFVTTDIGLPQGKKWDMLYLDGTFPPNTTASISVLSSTGKLIEGFKDLPGLDVDLSGILPSFHRTIKVRVTVASEFNNTTPVLDSLLVKWQDLGTWRDEFYGPAKVDRSLNLGVSDRRIASTYGGGTAPQLIFPSLRSDEGYMTLPTAYLDGGGLDYNAGSPMTFNVRGTSAVDTIDVNGDGHMDLVLAVHQKGETIFNGLSPLFMGTPLGMRDTPAFEFPTTGASDVVAADLNGDGFVDFVFAQELKAADDWDVPSTLFWGSATGWNSTPDLQATTTWTWPSPASATPPPPPRTAWSSSRTPRASAPPSPRTSSPPGVRGTWPPGTWTGTTTSTWCSPTASTRASPRWTASSTGARPEAASRPPREPCPPRGPRRSPWPTWTATSTWTWSSRTSGTTAWTAISTPSSTC